MVAQLVLQVIMVLQAGRGQLVQQVQALWVQQDQQGHKARQVQIALGLQVRQVHSVLLARLLLLPALRVQRGQLVIQALQVLPAQLALLAKPALVVLRVQPVHSDPLDQLELKVLKAL